MTKNLTRRTFGKLTLGAGAAAPFGFTRKAWAQERSISVGIWGGAQGEFVKTQIIPAFEQDFDCRVLPEEGFTLANISKMRATKDNPTYSVMFVDDVAIPICKAEGLIDELPFDDMPASANLYDRFIYEDGFGTGLGISVASIFHNSGVEPPARYADLWNPEYARNVKLVSPKNTPSMFFLIVAASIATGKPFSEAQYEIESAWKLVEEFKPNVQNVYDSGIQAVNEVAQRQADVGLIEYSKYVYPYTVQGAPVTMGYCEEGTFAGTNCQVLVKDGPHRDIAIAFMNRMLEPAVQKALAEFALIAPPVSGIEFDAETLKYISYPLDKMEEQGLFTPDWTNINANRSAWTEKLNQIFAT